MKPVEQRMEQLERDRRALTVGTAVTAVATIGFFLAPEVADAVATDAVAVDPLQWWGGVVGGGVAGWLTSESGSGALVGLKAALFGLGVAYVAAVVLYFAYGAAVGTFPPPGLALVAVLLYYLLPLLVTHLFGGLIAGAVLHRVGTRES